MGKLDEPAVRQLVDCIYRASVDGTLWPKIVRRLKDAPWPGVNSDLIGHNTPPADAPPAGEQYLSDSVSQSAYIADQPAPVSWPLKTPDGKTASKPRADELAGSTARAGAVHMGPVEISSIHVPGMVGREDLDVREDLPRADLDRVLLGHIHLALQVVRKMEEMRQNEKALETSLDRLAIGLILINEAKQVASMNSRAKVILANRDLELRGSRLTTVEKRARLQLEELLSGLVGEKGEAPASGAVTIRRMDGHALQVWGMPLQSGEPCVFESNPRVCAILFVIDPDSTPQTPEALLMNAFGLTRAETALTLAILQGETVEEYCERIGITRNTARTHMRAIFDKLGINKQTELIRMLSGFRLLDFGEKD